MLLIRRADTGDWSLPGGKLEYGEHVYDGARRELFEETGGRIRGQFTHAYFKAEHWPDFGPPFVGLCVAGWIHDISAVHNKEPTKHTDIQWFDVKSVPDNTWDRQAICSFLTTAGMIE